MNLFIHVTDCRNDIDVMLEMRFCETSKSTTNITLIRQTFRWYDNIVVLVLQNLLSIFLCQCEFIDKRIVVQHRQLVIVFIANCCLSLQQQSNEKLEWSR